MTSKQIANVLLKIVGLFLCLSAIPQLVSSIVIPLIWVWPHSTTNYSLLWANALGVGVRAVAGIVVIAMSQTIAGWMFKSDDI